MAKGHLALTREIDGFRQQFEQISSDGEAIVAPLTDLQFNWQPSPDAWSVAQCFEHLNVAARVYLPKLDDGIGEAIRQGLYGEGPFSHGWLGRLFVGATAPPPRLRLQTAVSLQPPPTRSRQEVMAAFRAYQVQFIDRLRQANGLDLARARVSSPLAPWLRFSLASGFALMVAHEHRHLWQARKVTEMDRFPLA